MSVDTKAILRKGVTIEQIEKAMSDKYTDVEVHSTNDLNYKWLNFSDKEDTRRLFISFSNDCEKENGISGVWCCLGCWGNSVEILRYLCETFGGYLNENDCDNKGFYPINFELYLQGKEYTELDLFKNKVIEVFGYENLEKAISLLTEFKNIKL